MDLASMVKAKKEELRAITDKEKELKGHLQELNELIDQKKKAEERVALLEKDLETKLSQV